VIPNLATDKAIKLAILRKMLRLEFIGGRHTLVDNLPKGFPKSERGRIMKVVKRMHRDGYFIVRAKGDGLHVSLNPKILRQVRYELESEE